MRRVERLVVVGALSATACAGAVAEPVPAIGAMIADSVSLVWLVGDTLTVRPVLLASDSAEIRTARREWWAIADPVFLDLTPKFRVTALRPTGYGETVALFEHRPSGWVAVLELVILPVAETP